MGVSEFQFSAGRIWQVIAILFLGFAVVNLGLWLSRNYRVEFIGEIIAATGVVIALCSPYIVWFFAVRFSE